MNFFDVVVDAKALPVALAGYSRNILWINTNSFHNNTLCTLYLCW